MIKFEYFTNPYYQDLEKGKVESIKDIESDIEMQAKELISIDG